MTPHTTIIISYWVKRSSRSLFNLLRQIEENNPGSSFSVVVVCNGGDVKPLTLPNKFNPLNIKVQGRPNNGYNLGAWEYGWRQNPDSDYFLFLQDDCLVLREGWLLGYIEKFQQQNNSDFWLYTH